MDDELDGDVGELLLKLRNKRSKPGRFASADDCDFAERRNNDTEDSCMV